MWHASPLSEAENIMKSMTDGGHSVAIDQEKEAGRFGSFAPTHGLPSPCTAFAWQ